MTQQQYPSSGAIRAKLTALKKQKAALDAAILALERYATAAGSGPPVYPAAPTPRQPASRYGRHRARRLKGGLCQALAVALK